MSHPFALVARSALFNVLFYANMVVRMIVALPAIGLPHAYILGVLRGYARSSLALLRTFCAITVEWRGREKLPAGSYIVACKHQSLWETFALFALLPDPTYVLKRELMWLPLFGWLATKAGMIPIDRGARVKALADMTAAARRAIADGRQIVIFPEGTRRAPHRAICRASPISMPRPDWPVCPSRSIPGCSGPAVRCAAIPARCWSRCSIRSRRDWTRGHS